VVDRSGLDQLLGAARQRRGDLPVEAWSARLARGAQQQADQARLWRELVRDQKRTGSMGWGA
jgi:hypothetical protein